MWVLGVLPNPVLNRTWVKVANPVDRPEQRASQSRKWQLIGKSQWCCGAMQPIHFPR